MSDSSTDDEEDDIISLISGSLPSKKLKTGAKGELPARATVTPPSYTSAPTHESSVASRLKSHSRRSQTPESETFSIELPLIFRTDAKRNIKVSERARVLQKSLREGEIALQTKYNDVMLKKQHILRELNDNGSCSLKVYTLERDKSEIESLVQEWIYDEDDSVFSIPRHFYFFKNVYEIAGLPMGSFQMNKTILFYALSDRRQWTQLMKEVEGDIRGFLNYVMSQVMSIPELEQLVKFLVECPYHDELNKELPAVSAYFNLMCEKDINIKQLPLKIVQFANYNKLNLLRACVIFSMYLRFDSVVDENLLPEFVFILLDYNVNKHNYKELMEFVRTIFPQLIKRSPNVESFVVAFNLELSNLHAIIKTHDLKLFKSDYELSFNVLRLLNLAITADTKDVVNRLNNLFVCDHDNTSTSYRSILQNLNKSFKANNLKESLSGENGVEAANMFYRDSYRTFLLPFVLTVSYTHNERVESESGSAAQLVEKDTEHIRKQNTTRLKELVSLLDDLKNKMHANIRILGFSDRHNSSIFNKDDMVRQATDSFHTVTDLYNRFQADLNLIKDDIFYE